MGDLWGVWVAEEDSDADAGVCLAGEELHHAGVLEEEQAAVDEDVDLLFSAGEVLVPDVAGDGSTVGVDGADLGAEQGPGEFR